MIKKNLNAKELRKLLGKVSRNCRLSVYLPFAAVRNPTWDEVRQYAAEAYSAAITDVLDALSGDSSGLHAAMTEKGRTLVSPEHVEYLREALQQAFESRTAKHAASEDPGDMEDEDDREEEKEPSDSKE